MKRWNRPFSHASVPRQTTRAVVLARGLDTRMRERDAAAALDVEQERAASAGLKAMIPVGRPFLDYVLSALVDAGLTNVCIVIGPEHSEVRERYGKGDTRAKVSFAIQDEPRGTADALLAAEAFTAGEPFVVLNSDNYYPVAVLAKLASLGEPGLPAFGREALLADGAIAPERIAGYALLDIAPGGYLRRIVEKPDARTLAEFGEDAHVSMNCWRFSSEIFPACRTVRPSSRGELEIPIAVQHAMDAYGARFLTFPVHEGVLDLSRRGDVADVKKRLSAIEPEP
jgi:glucose-1-phosphate thymidylyltransferase